MSARGNQLLALSSLWSLHFFFYLLLLACSLGVSLEAMDNDLYRLHMGDQLRISVYGDTVPLVTSVDPTGSIYYTFAGRVPALGRTVAEVRQDLQERIGTTLNNPILLIEPVFYTGNTYTILGEVKAPGSRTISGTTTLLSALCEAGGFTHRNYHGQNLVLADLDHSFITRRGEYLPIDFNRLVQGDLREDILIEAGDYIFIKTLFSQEVYVLGEVGSPNYVGYFNPISLAQAITKAGGMTERASSRVVVLRGALCCPERFLIDINRIVKGKACDFPLLPGDIVYVPPRRFTTLRDIVKSGISSFVGQVANIAGNNTYISIQPAALGNTELPVQTFGTSTPGINAPVAPVASP